MILLSFDVSKAIMYISVGNGNETTDGQPTCCEVGVEVCGSGYARVVVPKERVDLFFLPRGVFFVPFRTLKCPNENRPVNRR